MLKRIFYSLNVKYIVKINNNFRFEGNFILKSHPR